MSEVAWIKSSDSITLCFSDGEPITISKNQPNYAKVVEAVRENDWEKARRFSTPVRIITSSSNGGITVEDGKIMYKGIEQHNWVAIRILELLNEGFDVVPLMNFLSNTLKNPSFRAIKELYKFMEVGKLPITMDGHFLAYKKVRDNYYDIHSGTMLNKPGMVVSMPRNEVDDDSNRTCSTGLHFCSYDYLSHFGNANSRTVILKINPADVVSIPRDYNDTKGRCCKYKVLRDLTDLSEMGRSVYVEALSSKTTY